MKYPKPIKKEGKFICPECDKEYKTHGGFINHYKNTHSELLDANPKVNKETVDNIKEITQRVVDTLPELKRLETPKITKGNLKPESWVLVVSDFHYGQLVKAIEVGGLSEYNPKIARERMTLLADRVIRFREYHPNKPNELVIAGLGDMVDGSILRGNQQSNIEFGVCQQLIEAVEIFADFIVMLAGYFPRIRFYGVYGNHARLTPNPKDAPPSENFDLLLYHFLQQRLVGVEGVSVDYTEAQHMIVEVNKNNFWLDHGDTVRGWAGYPYYGADRQKNNIMNVLSMFKEKADYMLMGHHHRLAFFNNIIGNGSFVGGDLFSIGKLRRMGIAEQMLFAVNDRHGVVWYRPIQLSDPSKMSVKVYRS